MRFPHEIQSAILYDRPVGALDDVARMFLRLAGSGAGGAFAISEAKPGVFYRLFHPGDQLMVTLEYMDRPPNTELFRQPLGSAVTGLLCPDVRERVMRCRTHVLIAVSHGVLGHSPQVLRLLQQVAMPIAGNSRPEFVSRLQHCAMLTRILLDHAPASLVHWVQSSQLIAGEMFETYASGAVPGPLHVQPYLFGEEERRSGPPKVGIRTLGACHFIDREILVEPSALPWAASYEMIMAFLAVATVENGYIIPDGDSFGQEDGRSSCRVLHREAEPGDVPLYELVPLMHQAHDFVSADYVPRSHRIDDRVPPASVMPEDDEAKMALVNSWREKREMAARLGVQLEIRARDGAPATPPPIRPGPGGRPVFGRKGVQ